MVRINEFGEIVRDGSPPPPVYTPPPPSPPPPSRPARRPTSSGNSGPILTAVIACTVILGLTGGILGYGAGQRWCKTDVPESGKWNKTMVGFFRGVYLDSWTKHPVHHPMQDVTLPLRVLLMIAAGIGLVVAIFSDTNSAPSDNEGCGVIAILIVMVALATAVVGVLVRLLIYLLTLPVTWFVKEITTPVGGAFAVGLCWAAIGALAGLLIGAAIAEQRR